MTAKCLHSSVSQPGVGDGGYAKVTCYSCGMPFRPDDADHNAVAALRERVNVAEALAIVRLLSLEAAYGAMARIEAERDKLAEQLAAAEQRNDALFVAKVERRCLPHLIEPYPDGCTVCIAEQKRLAVEALQLIATHPGKGWNWARNVARAAITALDGGD